MAGSAASVAAIIVAVMMIVPVVAIVPVVTSAAFRILDLLAQALNPLLQDALFVAAEPATAELALEPGELTKPVTKRHCLATADGAALHALLDAVLEMLDPIVEVSAAILGGGRGRDRDDRERRHCHDKLLHFHSPWRSMRLTT
jgi:hypothetical protein